MSTRRRSGKQPTKQAPAKAAAPVRSFTGLLLAAAAAVLAAGAAFVVWPAIDREAATAGTEPGLVTKVESLYNDIYVYRRPNGNYVLSFGAERLRYIESIVNPNDELDLPVDYTQSMTARPRLCADARQRGDHRPRRRPHRLVPCTSPCPSLTFTAVELDPAVAEIADRYFGVRAEENFDVEIKDGRVWLARTETDVRHHPRRRLSRAVRPLPPADHRVLRAGRRRT